MKVFVKAVKNCSLHEKSVYLYNVSSTKERSKKTLMEIMKITDTSIKITLLPSEAKEYDLKEDLELDNKEMKEVFSRLLLKAKKEVGFNFAGENIVAEIFCAKDGGYEIFVSYLKSGEKMYKEKGESKNKTTKQIFLVDNLENVLEIFARLKKTIYQGKSSLYYDFDKEKYYIILEDVSKKDLNYAFIGEFAKFIRGNQVEYLQDNFECICKNNAVELLSRLL